MIKVDLNECDLMLIDILSCQTGELLELDYMTIIAFSVSLATSLNFKISKLERMERELSEEGK